MISAPTLKSFISFLANEDGASAVYDEKFVLRWRNDKFFDTFDVSEIKAMHLMYETHFKTVHKGESAVMTVTPIYKSKRVVDAYAINIKNVYHIYKMLGCTSASDYMPVLFDSYKQQTDKLIEVNRNLLDNARTRKEADILDSQIRALTGINNDMETLLKAAFAKKEPINVNCNVSLLTSIICKDASSCLSDVKRSLNVKVDDKNYYTKISYELFVIAAACILNYHMALSPLKSGISVVACCEKDKDFHITVKSKLNPEETDEYSEMYAAAKRTLAEKIIKNDCGGDYKYYYDDKTTVTEIKISVFLKNRGSMLTSRNSAYLDPDYKPVRAMLNKSVESEIEQLEELKMQASKKKKLESFN